MPGGQTDIDALARELSALMAPASDLLAGRRPGPVDLYLDLAASAWSLDLAGPEAVGFQRRFNGFYGVRRNAAWRTVFYATFEAAKSLPANAAELFRWGLDQVEAATGRVEASFVSKLVATLHPQAPVLDSVVRAFLTARMATPPFGAGHEEAVSYYDWLDAVMRALSQTGPALAWSQRFDAQFSATPGAAAIDPIKKLDFLIWAGGRT